ASLDPRDELTSAGMLIVRNQAGSASLQLIERQTDGLRIEFGVVQKRQLAQPLELTVATSETSREPIGNFDANDPFRPASVENDGTKCPERCHALRHGRHLGGLAP